MRRMSGPRRILNEEWLARHGLIESIQIIDGLIGHACGQIPAGLALERINLRGVAVQVGLPLVGVATNKTIEILEAHAGGPLVKRPYLAGRKRRGIVVLAKPRGRVAVVQQHPTDGGLVLGDNAVVAGESRGLLRNHAEPHRMMVTASDERRARRRTQSGGMDVVVAQAILGNAVQCGRRDDAAEGTRHAKSGVICDDEQHIGGLLGRHDARCPPRFRSQCIIFNHATKFRITRWKLATLYRRGSAGRTRRAGRFILAHTGVVCMANGLLSAALGFFRKRLGRNESEYQRRQNNQHINQSFLFQHVVP